MKTVQTKMTATTAVWPCAASRARRPLRPRTRLIPEAIAAAHRAPALRRRQVPHLRVSQGKEQTVLGESALSRYSDLSLKAYSQSVTVATRAYFLEKNSEKAKKDSKKTEDLFETLMGKQAELRFKFIQSNANFIKNLDI